MRPCVESVVVSGRYLEGSNSVLKLLVDNEVSGSKCFKCLTIEDLGECLGAECVIFLYRGCGGSGVEPLMGVRGREPPAVAESMDPVVVGAVPHLISGWDIPDRQCKGFSKRSPSTF